MDWGDMAHSMRASFDIGRVQTIRKMVLAAAVFLLVAAFLFVGSWWPEGGDVHESLEWIGIGLIIVCILGRTWCTLYIGGRKNAAVVDEGPYSVTRNPLYVFSFVGAAGVGAQLGSFVLAVLATVFVWVVFRIVVSSEERHLRDRLGGPYRDYLARVPRFLPRLSLWRNADSLEVRPGRVVRTFLDACMFLVAIPLAEVFEWLQNSGIIPVLLRVP
jgi:protein-S-isoprenylcysteine O-methyltransferase Ste14